jgi:hypothetical protein
VHVHGGQPRQRLRRRAALPAAVPGARGLGGVVWVQGEEGSMLGPMTF